jgi:regulator of protease activity HflC (stomatin/prohibitin superfamily)
VIKEKETRSLPGFPVLFLLIGAAIVLFAGTIFAAVNLEADVSLVFVALLVGCILLEIVVAIGFGGLTAVNPNESRAIVLFGRYKGTLRQQGFWWVNPFTMRKKISVRVRIFESPMLKVNDHDGNPIEIASVVVWRVTDTAEALFEVDDYENFVHVQAESALRNLATSHPYDAHQDGQLSLRANTNEVAEQLKVEIQARLQKAGVEVIEARISHLAYAPEIANAMLRRQQASAVIAARSKIVEGAVSMVQMALEPLAEKQIVALDEERKAAMVSNLLVVLCSEHETQPVLNAGTLYQG